MTLEQYIKILDIDNPIEQLKVLGYSDNITVGKAREIIKKEMDLNYEPKLISSFRLGGYKFKLFYDIEDMPIQEYSLFKQIVGDIYSNTVDSEDNEIEIPENDKFKKLFKKANVILAIFCKQVRWIKRELSFNEKQELFMKMDLQLLISILFFYLNVIKSLQTNGTIYYIQKVNQTALDLLGQD